MPFTDTPVDPRVVADLVAALKECSFRLALLIAYTGTYSPVNAKALDQATAALAHVRER